VRSYRQTIPTGIDALEMIEEDSPAPGPGQVLVRVRATSLNFRDPLLADGRYPFPSLPGLIPLSDAAGEVERVGDGVTRFAVGDRVVDSFNVGWHGGKMRSVGLAYGADLDGWLTERRVVGEHELASLPAHLSFEEGATLPCVAVTAWSALADVGPGDTVLTQGSGGVSLFALQLGKAIGARVIATTSSEAKAERLRELGADHVIDYVATPEWAQEVLEVTDGGADRVVEVGGPGTMPESLKAVVPGGEIAFVGLLSPSGDGLNLVDLFLRQAALRTVGIGSRTDLEEMNRTIAAHEIHPVVDRVFPFDDARAAFEHFASEPHFGKVVIRH
jgi:NADPH:quinone reductase-like Zn-dependent oxidoreductase